LFSFNDSRFWAFPLRGFTWRWYEELMQRSDALAAAKKLARRRAADDGDRRADRRRVRARVASLAFPAEGRRRRPAADAAAHSEPDLGPRAADLRERGEAPYRRDRRSSSGTCC
jgi:hypothetical protein